MSIDRPPSPIHSTCHSPSWPATDPTAAGTTPLECEAGPLACASAAKGPHGGFNPRSADDVLAAIVSDVLAGGGPVQLAAIVAGRRESLRRAAASGRCQAIELATARLAVAERAARRVAENAATGG